MALSYGFLGRPAAAAGVVDDASGGERRATTDPARSASEDRKPATRADRRPTVPARSRKSRPVTRDFSPTVGIWGLLSDVTRDVIRLSPVTGGYHG